MDAANESWVLRFFGVKEAEVCRTASGLAGRYGLTQVESRSQGAETLLALTAPAPALHKAQGRLRRAFRAGLYGTGEETLADCAARALVRHDRLLVCGDKLALELLASRLEGREGADRAFDFGAGSCNDPDTCARIDALAARGRKNQTEDPVRFHLRRLRAALRVTRADLAAGALARDGKTMVAVASRKGCWFYWASAEDNPALWLLDLIRRAADGSPQAPEVRFVRRGRQPPRNLCPANAVQAETTPAAARHRWPVRLALVLGVVALAGLAAALRLTDGDLTALPGLIRNLMEGSQMPAHSGAALL